MLLGGHEWYIAGENRWYILAENNWRIMGGNKWHIYVRYLTAAARTAVRVSRHRGLTTYRRVRLARGRWR